MTSRTLLNLSLLGSLLALTSFACARPAVVVAAPGPGGLEAWEHNHPEAARDLGVWVRTHPDAAKKFFAWDSHHPERSHAFVTWAIAHPGEGIPAFSATHPRWEHFDDIMLNHAPAANAFIGWCRRHPQAAEALMSHPGGLDWAGRHLYGASWVMEGRR